MNQLQEVQSINTMPHQAVAIKKTDDLKEILFNREEQVTNLVNRTLKKLEPGFAEQLINTFYLAINRNPQLHNTPKSSMVSSLYFCAERALLPINGKVWLIPFKGECTPIIGVQGYRELIRRNPKVIRLENNIVREKDEFKYISGTNPHIHHVPNILEDSMIIGAYAYAEIKGSDYCTIRYCNKIEIDKSRKESKTGYKEGSIWSKYPDEMTRLIPLKRLAKELITDEINLNLDEKYQLENTHQTKASRLATTLIDDEELGDQ